MFSKVVLTVCDVGLFMLWLGAVFAVGGRNIGASLHPPMWLERFISGRLIFK